MQNLELVPMNALLNACINMFYLIAPTHYHRSLFKVFAKKHQNFTEKKLVNDFDVSNNIFCDGKAILVSHQNLDPNNE